ncbi:hypothetical protein AAG663_17460 [Bacillus licheniformis]
MNKGQIRSIKHKNAIFIKKMIKNRNWRYVPQAVEALVSSFVCGFYLPAAASVEADLRGAERYDD